MTKKRSKTANKKKAAANKKKKRLQSLFGVVARDHNSNLSLLADGSSKKAMSRSVPNRIQRKRRRTHIKTTIASTTEQADFDREMASLQERSSTARKGTSTRSSNRHQPSVSIQPAIFLLDDSEKPTSRLVEETMQHVDRTGLEDVGDAALSVEGHSARRGDISRSYELQALAAQQRNNERMNRLSFVSQNPFSSLEVEDSDDDQGVEGHATAMQPGVPSKPRFQFAPASFHVPNEENSRETGVDPDL